MALYSCQNGHTTLFPSGLVTTWPCIHDAMFPNIHLDRCVDLAEGRTVGRLTFSYKLGGSEMKTESRLGGMNVHSRMGEGRGDTGVRQTHHRWLWNGYLRMEAVDGRLSVEGGRRTMLMMGTVN
jgi:hypothetical protein